MKAMEIRTDRGTFKRVHKPWSLETFDDGYVDSDGRFRVYAPGHHRAYADGYALRAIVAYELYTGEIVLTADDIHHKDHNRTNDTPENLERKGHQDHSLHHHRQVLVDLICRNCGASFRRKPHQRGKGFCTRACGIQAHHRASRAARTLVERACLNCGNVFRYPSTWLKRLHIYCSHACAAKAQWANRRKGDA